MPKKEKKIIVSSPVDEPSIGFARAVGPPAWWYSAFAVVVILFLIVIFLTFIRSWLKPSTSTDSSEIFPDVSRTLTNSPYRQDSFLSLPPNKNFELTITPEGITTSNSETKLNVDDLILVFNKDSIKHIITIQGDTYTVSPNEVYAHKISTRGTLKLEIGGVKDSRSLYTFTVR